MRFADIRTEWRVEDIERQLRSKVDNYEVFKISSDVDRLEYSLRELRSLVDGLRFELEACKSELNEIRQRETL